MPVSSAPLRRLRLRFVPPAVLLALAACAPDLPAEATQRAAEQAAQLEAGFTAAGRTYEQSVEQAWAAEAARSGAQVRVTTACDSVRLDAANATGLLDEVAAQPDSAASAVAADWQSSYGALQGHIAACALEILPRMRPAGLAFSERERPRESSRAAVIDDFAAEFRTLAHVQTLYYRALARAAAGEDIQALAAAARELAAGLGNAAGTASMVVAQANIGPIVTALLNLAGELENALRVADRYDLIQQTLETVNPSMQEVENAMGLATLVIVSEAAKRAIAGELTLYLTLYNATAPQDLAQSYQHLSSAVESMGRARAIVDPALMRGVSQLADLHQTLLDDVRRRDGQFAATLGRLASIAASAEALVTAIDTFESERP
ncbi:MAG: hypothetical protein H6843_07835 [Rhodospirillaceae bacterium]|nr:hypothetical protein [Rhodospirillaceae bacterium]